ncbi:hypothetical protein Tco_1056446 [Tanacetum coccineum]|uniref:Xylulose kinase-1 n=1 Tax=Tanacetum coccineum TaxID=301880 RepID=A0ABQ5H2R7_9ASTR
MVAYLEKSIENDDFDEIVDFVNANPIRYALTISPTICVSYIEQFWSTAKIKIVNNERQIRAKVNGKTIVMSESSVRRDLQFNDKDCSGQPTKPQHTPTTALPSNIEKTQKRRKNKRPTEISQSSRPTTLVVDETVHEEREDSMEKAATTAISLDVEKGSGVNTLRSGEEILKIMELMEIYTKLFDTVLALENVKTAQDLEITSLKKRVKKLEKKKKARTPQLKRRLFKVKIESSADKSLGDQEDASKQGRNIAESDQDEEISFVQEDAEIQGSTAEPSTPPTTTVIKDEDLTIAQTLMKIRSEKSKEKEKERGSKENFSEPATRPTRGVTMQEPKKPLKKKDQIKFDEEVAKRLTEELEAGSETTRQAKEQGELTIEERSKLFVELMKKGRSTLQSLELKRSEENHPLITKRWNHKFLPILRNMVGYKNTQLKNKSFEEIQMLFDKEMKRVNSFVPIDSEVMEGSGKKTESSRKETVSKKRAGEELDEESVKRQKLEYDAEKTHILTEDKMYYGIIRADGSTKFYKIFTKMLDDFDRQDMLDLQID